MTKAFYVHPAVLYVLGSEVASTIGATVQP